MRLTRFENTKDFYQRVEPFLLNHEPEHNLILGWSSALVRQPDDYQKPYLAVVEDDGVVQATFLMTLPYYAVISFTTCQEALSLFVYDLYADFKTISGVAGAPEICRVFAAEWQKISGQAYHQAMAQRLYQLNKVNQVEGVVGHFRRATEADRPLLLEWMVAFETEASVGTPPDEAHLEKVVNMMLTSPVRDAYFWEDEKPVSFSAYGGLTPNGVRIGPVYTPPEYRGRGYASACVAALSQCFLDSGRKFVVLLTDLANPTSNHIYQVISYNPVTDINMLEFELPKAG
jgi:uncharacterized protein